MRRFFAAYILSVVALSVTASTGYATGAFSFTLPGDTFSLSDGQGFYEYSVTTNGTNGVRNQANSVTANWPFGGDLSGPHPDDYITDSEWEQIGQDKAILLQGSIPIIPETGQNGLAGLPSPSPWPLTYLQIGFITREYAEYAAEDAVPELQAMFDESVYVQFWRNDEDNVGVLAGDYASLTTSPQYFSITDPIYYEMVVDHGAATPALYFRVADNDSWAYAWYELDISGDPLYYAWDSVSIGSSQDPGGPVAPEDFSQSALLVQLKNIMGSEDGTTITFGDITVTAIPEPVSLIFFGTGLVGVLGFAKRRRTRRG